MIRVNVDPGICGFKTEIGVSSEDQQTAALVFKTECPNLKPLEQELTEADAYQECFAKVGTGTVFETVRKYCKHAACPIPTALLKGIEAACGLALPRSVRIEMNKDEQ